MFASLIEKVGETVIGAMILVWVKKWFAGATWKTFATGVWADAGNIWKGFTSMGWLSAFTGIGIYLRLAALLGSFGVGVYVTHWYYHVADLERVNAQYAKDAKRTKVILGLNEKIDASADDVEKSNQEILDALTATKVKADKAPLIETVSVPQSCPTAKPHPACLTDAGMRKLAKLR